MDNFERLLEFLYYSIIIFIIVLFFTMIIDIVSTRIFPQDTHTYILAEIFMTWIILSIMIFYSKQILYIIPYPFAESSLKKNDDHVIIILSLITLLVACSVKNIRNKISYLYDDVEKYFK